MTDERTHIYEIVNNSVSATSERTLVWWNEKKQKTESNNSKFLAMLKRDYWEIGPGVLIDSGPEYLDALPSVFRSYLFAKRVG